MSISMNNGVRISEPGDFLAAVPHLLGFTPSDSLVVIVLSDQGPEPSIGATLRMDLPDPGDYAAVAEYLIDGPLRTQRARLVLLAVIGTPDHSDVLVDEPPDESIMDPPVPYSDLVDVLHEALSATGVGLVHAMWTPEIEENSPWWCYTEEDCHGYVPDPRSSHLAVTMAAAGSVTFESRQELQRLVAPEDEQLLARRSARLDALTEDRESERGTTHGAREDVLVVLDAIRRTAEGGALTEDDHLRVLLALSDHRVRDIALGAALDDRAHAAERLWLTLVRIAPPPEVADVAALLAYSAYVRGEGALASVALERIEQVRPDHRLGALLRQALDFGIPPGELELIARDAVADARILIEEDGAEC